MLLILKFALVPVAIKAVSLFPALWMRAAGWFVLGALFVMIPPRVRTTRQFLVGLGSCAAATALLLLIPR